MPSSARRQAKMLEAVLPVLAEKAPPDIASVSTMKSQGRIGTSLNVWTWRSMPAMFVRARSQPWDTASFWMPRRVRRLMMRTVGRGRTRATSSRRGGKGARPGTGAGGGEEVVDVGVADEDFKGGGDEAGCRDALDDGATGGDEGGGAGGELALVLEGGSPDGGERQEGGGGGLVHGDLGDADEDLVGAILVGFGEGQGHWLAPLGEAELDAVDTLDAVGCGGPGGGGAAG